MVTQVEAIRNEWGFWTHPELPNWNEDTTPDEVDTWFKKNKIKRSAVWMIDDVSEEISEKYANGEISLNEWEPTKPSENAFLLLITDTEDGGFSLFAIPE